MENEVQIIFEESWENTGLQDLLKTRIEKERNYYIANVIQGEVPNFLSEIASFEKENNVNAYLALHVYDINRKRAEDIYREVNRSKNPEVSFTMHFMREPLPLTTDGLRTCPTCNGFGKIK